MDYILHIAVLVGVYVTLAVSLDLLAGHTGVLSISQAAFCALGAYTSALLAVRLGIPFVFGLTIGMGVAALVSFMVSVPNGT